MWVCVLQAPIRVAGLESDGPFFFLSLCVCRVFRCRSLDYARVVVVVVDIVRCWYRLDIRKTNLAPKKKNNKSPDQLKVA